MNTEFPPAITAFVQALNEHNSAALGDCFTDDAVIHDEGEELEIQSRTAIRAWSERIYQEYRLALEVNDFSQNANEVNLIATVSGTFDGSPIQFQYHFRLHADRISSLKIQLWPTNKEHIF